MQQNTGRCAVLARYLHRRPTKIRRL